ncbi:MAG: hypothetical protein RRA94_00100 [Bacteroidota bacterium]|nr:hypothetical protein [Bacteroidota bacterium]
MNGFLKYSTAFLFAALFTLPVSAQEAFTRTVSLDGAREVVATINGGFGTLYLKRGRGNALLQIREKNGENAKASDIQVDYHVEDGIGYLTLDINTEGAEDMNALACLLQGRDSRTWYVHMNDRVPIEFDVTLGAGRASLDLTGLHVKGLRLDAGAGSVRMSVDRPNRQIIDKVSISAGVGSVQTRHLGNLRFRQLEFEGGLGSYKLDCTGALPSRTRISSDVGVGSMVITLPEGVGAKAMTSDHLLSSESMYRFVRRSDNIYATENFSSSSRKVLLDLQSGVGSISVRWAR